MASWWLRQSVDWPTILFANAILTHQLLGGGMEVNEGGVCDGGLWVVMVNEGTFWVVVVDEGGFWEVG